MEFNLFGAEDVRAMQRGGQQAWDDTGANIKGMRDQFTNARAGRAYASGDRQGAARMLAQGGNLDGARVLQGDLRAEQRQGMQDTQAAEALTYERGRDQKADARLKTADDVALAERNYTTLRRITSGLRGYQEGQRLPQLQRALPIFESLGIAVEPFAALTEDQLNDANLDVFEGELEKQWTFHNLGGGGIGRSDNRTGKYETLREPEKPPGNYIRGPDGKWMINPLAVEFKAQTRAPPKAVKGGNVGPAVNIDPSTVTWK
jgi:hypothetical protein